MEAKNRNLKTFAQHLNERYGETGTKKRLDFEIKAKSFAIGAFNEDLIDQNKSNKVTNS